MALTTEQKDQIAANYDADLVALYKFFTAWKNQNDIREIVSFEELTYSSDFDLNEEQRDFVAYYGKRCDELFNDFQNKLAG